jgi:hypothetical protein
MDYVKIREFYNKLEDAELETLEGAKNTILRYKPKRVVNGNLGT